MLKVERKGGLWRARIDGRPSEDLWTALRSLLVAVHGASDTIGDILVDAPCISIDGEERARSSAELFAAGAEFEFAVGTRQDAKRWEEPLLPGVLDGLNDNDDDDGQPSELTEWQDYDPDC